MTSSFRRRKNPPNQQLVAMRHLDSAPNTAGTGSDFGVTSPDNKTTATKMAAATSPATKGAAKMAANMATKMAAADLLDTVPKPRRPSLMDVRKVLSLDDFDAFCVQASSGGSVYGMLRKQIFQDGKKVPPGKRMMERQRSKSLTKTQGPRRRRFHRVTEGHALTSGLLGHPGVIVGQTDALRQRPEEG